MNPALIVAMAMAGRKIRKNLEDPNDDEDDDDIYLEPSDFIVIMGIATGIIFFVINLAIFLGKWMDDGVSFIGALKALGNIYAEIFLSFI